MNKSWIIFGCFSILLACEAEKTADSQKTPEYQTLENLIVDYYETMSARNWSAYQDFFSEEAVLTTIWQDSADVKPIIFSNTIAEFVAQTASGPDSQPIFEEKPKKIEVAIKNNLASVWVKYEAKFGSEKNLVEWQGYDLFSLIQWEGQWKITSLTYAESAD